MSSSQTWRVRYSVYIESSPNGANQSQCTREVLSDDYVKGISAGILIEGDTTT